MPDMLIVKARQFGHPVADLVLVSRSTRIRLAEPAFKGVELILVAAGLVQADLGIATPVLRSGDAVLATRASVLGWRNLLGEPARLFWIVRD